MANGFVTVLDPSGQRGEIPESGLEAALADGFTLPTAEPVEAPGAVPVQAAAPSRMVAVLDPSGQPGEIPEENLAGALADGFTQPNPNEGGLSQLATAAEGVLGLGFTEPMAYLEGIGSAAGSKIAGMVEGLPAEQDMSWSQGIQQARQDINARKEANPWTAGIGGAAGTVAVSLATGGAAAIPMVENLAARAAIATAAKSGIPIVVGEAAAANAARIAAGTLGQRVLTAATKALVLGGIEGGAYGAAAGVDAGIQAAYAVHDELEAGDYASIAESGLKGLALGAGLGGVFGATAAAVGEVAGASVKAAKGMFAKAAEPEARALPGLTVEAMQDTIATERALMSPTATSLLPEGAPAPGAGLATAAPDSVPGTGLATIGDAPPAFQNGLKQAVAYDAEGMIAKQGPLRFSDLPGDDVGRVRNLAETLRKSGTIKDIEAESGRRMTKALDKIAELGDEGDTLNGIAAKRVWAEQFNDGVARAPHQETVATMQNMANSLLKLRDNTVYELGQFGGSGKIKTIANAIQEHADRYAGHMMNGEAGTAAMVLDDLKRALGDFSYAKNDAIRTMITGLDGQSGVYGMLQRHLVDEQVFGAFAQGQAPVNATWSTAISASKDDGVRGMFVQAGKPATNSFKQAQRGNQQYIKDALSNTQEWSAESKQAAMVKYLRAKANDHSTRANTWGSATDKANAIEMHRQVQIFEDNYNAMASAAKAQGKVADVVDFAKDIPVVGGVIKTGVTMSQKLARAIGGTPSPAERVAHAAVATNITIAEYAQNAAQNAVKATPRRASAVERALPAAAALALVQSYARSTAPDSPESREQDQRAKDLTNEAPDLVQPLLSANAAKRDFIREKLGPVLASGKVDTITQSKIIRYIDASEHPEQALERISQGEARPEDVETLWHLYPSQIAKLRDQTLANIKASGKQPTREAQARLQFAFRMHDAAYLQWLQASTVPVKEETPAPVSASVSFAMPDTAGKADSLMR